MTNSLAGNDLGVPEGPLQVVSFFRSMAGGRVHVILLCPFQISLLSSGQTILKAARLMLYRQLIFVVATSGMSISFPQLIPKSRQSERRRFLKSMVCSCGPSECVYCFADVSI